MALHHSIVSITKEVKPLLGARLRTATGEDAEVVEEVACEVAIEN